MNHSTIWIDHEKAFIFEYNKNGVSEKTIIPHEAKNISKDHLKKFYHDVADLTKGSNHLLILGPGMAKMELKKHIEDHHPQLARNILQVETMKDHPSFGEILEHSNAFYKKHFQWGETLK